MAGRDVTHVAALAAALTVAPAAFLPSVAADLVEGSATHDDMVLAQVQRRPGPSEPREVPPAPPVDPGAVRAPPPSTFPQDFIPVPDRWRLLEGLGVRENLLTDTQVIRTGW